MVRGGGIHLNNSKFVITRPTDRRRNRVGGAGTSRTRRTHRPPCRVSIATNYNARIHFTCLHFTACRLTFLSYFRRTDDTRKRHRGAVTKQTLVRRSFKTQCYAGNNELSKTRLDTIHGRNTPNIRKGSAGEITRDEGRKF